MKIERLALWVALMVCPLASLNAQKKDSTFRESINISHPQSYITLLGGMGNIEPLYFEAAIIPYYMLRLNQSKWGIEISPKIILRMYQEESCPVRTPSYMPGATFYYNVSGYQSRRNASPLFLFATWQHHSNGQDGYFYNDDSISINTHSGNFSTNMIELGGFASMSDRSKAYNSRFHKISIEYHYRQNKELKNKYGNFRINSELQSIWYPGRFPSASGIVKNRLYSIQSQLKLQWIAGNMQNAEAFDIKRLVASVRIAIHPALLNEITMFVQYYYGQDYYNINFYRTLKVLRFGILTDLSNI